VGSHLPERRPPSLVPRRDLNFSLQFKKGSVSQTAITRVLLSHAACAALFVVFICACLQSTMDNDKACIARNECPICSNGSRSGVNPRRALQEHLRRCSDAKHKIWYTEHYKSHFVRGGDMTPRHETTIDDIKAAIARSFGNAWADRVHIS
jgi:hypothetical protein